ncbi:MBOAT family protein [Lachnospiraceae bacterium ZAX-1]
MIAGTITNITILLFFRTADVWLGLLPSLTGASAFIEVILPLGLSFFTLQGISYCVDVYNGKCASEKNPLYLGIYLSFFPKVIFGPLVSYSDMKNQMLFRKHTYAKFSAGICLFIIGLAKKIFIADHMTLLADYVFSWSAMGRNTVQVPVTLAWLGLLAYVLQLYFLLSAYSDMAMGLGMMMGFELPESFKYPYAADSISDFWRRFNITVTAWFRNYVFGAFRRSGRESKDTIVLDLLLIWILIGFWYGSKWTFVFWGLWNFLLLLAEHFFGYARKYEKRLWLRAYTILAVMLGLVLFRVENLYHAGRYYMNLLGTNHNAFFSDVALVLLRENWLWFVLGILFSLPVVSKFQYRLSTIGSGNDALTKNVAYPILMAGLLILTFIFMGQNSTVPFQYY